MQQFETFEYSAQGLEILSAHCCRNAKRLQEAGFDPMKTVEKNC